MKQVTIAVFFWGREQGNTKAYLDKVFKNALSEEENYKISNFQLKDYQIAPCTGCLACKDGPCVIQNDDVSFLLAEAEKADIIMIASPVYFAGLPSALKAFADRMQVQFFKIYGSKEKPPMKKAGLILSTQGSTDRRDSEAFERSAKMLCNTLWCKTPSYFPVYGCDMPANNLDGAAQEAGRCLKGMLEERL